MDNDDADTKLPPAADEDNAGATGAGNPAQQPTQLQQPPPQPQPQSPPQPQLQSPPQPQPQPPPQPKPQPQKQSATKQKVSQKGNGAKGHAGKKPLVFAVALIAVILAVASYVAFAHIKAALNPAQGASQQTPPALSQQANASMLVRAISGPASNSMQDLINVSASKAESSSQFNISYSGHVLISTGSHASGSVSLTVPLSVQFQKYGNNSRLSLNVPDSPILGNTSDTYISLANGTSYSCARQLYVSYNGFSNNSVNASDSISCTESSQPRSTAQQAIQYLSLIDPVNGAAQSSSIIGNRSYEGLACVLVSDSGNSTINASRISYIAHACLSDQYYVPLNLTIESHTLSNGSGIYNVSLSLEEVSIGIPVSEKAVTSMPWPIKQYNQSQPSPTTSVGGAPPYNSSSYGSQGSGNSSNETCTPPYGNLNTKCIGLSINPKEQMNLTIETTNYNAYRISVGCEITMYDGKFVSSGFPTYYAINSASNQSGTAQDASVGTAGASGNMSLIASQPITIPYLPCTTESTVPKTMPIGSQVSGTVWFMYHNSLSQGYNQTGILASFNTTIS